MRWKSGGVAWTAGVARRRKPRLRRKADGRRKNRREKEMWCEEVDVWDWRLAGREREEVEEEGANKSDRVPVMRRARVDVRANIVTWVEGRPAGGEAWREEGVSVGIIVPS